MSDSMSLWAIEESVAGLLRIIDDPEVQEDERNVAIAELERYVAAEVKKVDAVRAVIRHCEREEAEALAAKKMALQEAELQSGRAQTFASRRDRIKRMAMAAMEFMGVRKLEGKTGRLRVQANGGKQALTITDPTLPPARLIDTTVRMPADLWEDIVAEMTGHTLDRMCSALTRRDEPSNERIRKVLETPCEKCEGSGINQELPCMREGGQSANDDAEIKKRPLDCPECAGTGRKLVPGARLEPRGESLRVE